jgi:hypothetical protein
MRYSDERQNLINDANRHNPTVTVEDTRNSMLAYFQAKKEEEEKARANAKKVNGMAYSYRPENNGRDSKDGKYFIYNKTHYTNIVGEKVEY